MFKKGYTVIELLAVMSTMAIMASVTLPNFHSITQEAKYTKANAEVKTLQSVVERYHQVKGVYPESLDLAMFPQEINITDAEIKDPFTGKNYLIEFAQNYYVIYSPGENQVKDFNLESDKVQLQGDDVIATNLLKLQ